MTLIFRELLILNYDENVTSTCITIYLYSR